MSIVLAAKQLSVTKSSLHKWVALARGGNLSRVGQGQRIPSELEVVLARIRKELAITKMEREKRSRTAHT